MSSIFIVVVRELKKFYVYECVVGPTPYKSNYCISMDFFILYYKCNGFVTPQKYILFTEKRKVINN